MMMTKRAEVEYQTPLSESNSTAGCGEVFKNNYIAIEMIPSRFGPFTQVKNGNGFGSAVLIVRDGQILMVKQPRYAVDSTMWEIPRGSSEKMEDLATSALREMQEETGLEAGYADLHSLGNIFPDTGILNTEVGLFVAVLPEGRPWVSEDNEIDDMVWVDANELVEACAYGKVKDAFTNIAVMRARLKGLI